MDDLLLAKEAQLVYSNTTDFAPHEGSLQKWRGEVRGRGGETFLFEIFLPELFPNVPPVVTAVTPMQHPNVDGQGFVSLRILESWRAEFHTYQVINAIQGLMSRVPPVPSTTPLPKPMTAPRPTPAPSPIRTAPAATPAPSSQELSVMKEEIDRLKKEVSERDEEIVRARARRALVGSEAPSTVDPLIELESEQIATSELLASLHEKYSSGEASLFDFARLYRKYSKELYLAKKKLDYAQENR